MIRKNKKQNTAIVKDTRLINSLRCKHSLCILAGWFLEVVLFVSIIQKELTPASALTFLLDHSSEGVATLFCFNIDF